MKNLKSFVLLLLYVLPISVFAQLEGNPENWCRNGAFSKDSDQYTIAKVIGAKAERIYFYDDSETDCPNNEKCRLKSYVIPNDEVIVSRRFGNFACAWFQPKRGDETVGWIALEKLKFVEAPLTVGKEDWSGKWNYGTSEITIKPTANKNIYKITGSAVWQGIIKENVHVGELDGESHLTGSILKYIDGDEADEFSCQVNLRLAGNFLIVSDNLKCGGVNVTFSGVYQKASQKNKRR